MWYVSVIHGMFQPFSDQYYVSEYQLVETGEFQEARIQEKEHTYIQSNILNDFNANVIFKINNTRFQVYPDSSVLPQTIYLPKNTIDNAEMRNKEPESIVFLEK